MAITPVHSDAATAAFLEGTARGEFLLLRDTETGELLDPRTDISFARDRFEYVAASGRGTVVSWAAPHTRLPDGTTRRSIVGIVELEEGPWWWSSLDGFAEEEDPMGAAVVVGFEPSGPGEDDAAIPCFTKAV